ncbi:hypothetical protein [Massilia timonae]|uniref:hypothetical protein n=1 Tax=Massilia timonae TaxID=47229 RepID=UPI00161DDA2D|nr:hypothetical protein [Massilia timonae]
MDENMPWLSERWAAARTDDAARSQLRFPPWYFEDSTQRQHSRASALDVSLSPAASKGQFSDVIGLFDEVDEEDLEKLAFFGIKLTGSNRNASRARHEISLLDADPDSAQRWAARPPSKLQKEFFRFAGVKAPPGLTAVSAEALIKKELKSLSREQSDSWDAFTSVVDDFNDPVFREGEGIRKPAMSDLRMAFQALVARQDGNNYPDAGTVADYMLMQKPELARG